MCDVLGSTSSTGKDLKGNLQWEAYSDRTIRTWACTLSHVLEPHQAASPSSSPWARELRVIVSGPSMFPVIYVMLNWIKWCKTSCSSKVIQIWSFFDLLVWSLLRGVAQGSDLKRALRRVSSVLFNHLSHDSSFLSPLSASLSPPFLPSPSSSSVLFGTVNLTCPVFCWLLYSVGVTERNYRKSLGVLEHNSHHHLSSILLCI